MMFSDFCQIPFHLACRSSGTEPFILFKAEVQNLNSSKFFNCISDWVKFKRSVTEPRQRQCLELPTNGSGGPRRSKLFLVVVAERYISPITKPDTESLLNVVYHLTQDPKFIYNSDECFK